MQYCVSDELHLLEQAKLIVQLMKPMAQQPAATAGAPPLLLTAGECVGVQACVEVVWVGLGCALGAADELGLWQVGGSVCGVVVGVPCCACFAHNRAMLHEVAPQPLHPPTHPPSQPLLPDPPSQHNVY